MRSAEQDTIISPAGSKQSGQTSTAIALCLLGFATSSLCGLLHPNGIVHFDDLTHYLYAKWAWTWPAYLLDNWGRPGFTIPYALPAAMGWEACRILSALFTSAAAFLAFRVAQNIGLPHAWAAVPLAYLQPLYFQLSQTTLTETPMAFYLVLAVFLAQKSRWTASAAIISLTFITRHEAIVLLPVWLLAAFLARVPLRRLWPILWAPLAVNLVAPLFSIRPAVAQFLDPTRAGQYGHGGWLTYFCRSLEAFGPAITILAMAGIAILYRRGDRIVVMSIVVYFAAQTIVRALGLYDSGGYARFLVPLSPLIAVAALAGWNRLISVDARERQCMLIALTAAMILLWLAMERQLVLHAAHMDEAAEVPRLHVAISAMRLSTVAIVGLAVPLLLVRRFDPAGRRTRAIMPGALILLMFLAVYALCHPLRPPPEARIIADALMHLKDMGLANREIVSANVWLDYATGRKQSPWRHTVREQLIAAPIGTLFAWERQFAGSPEHGMALKELESDPALRPILATPPAPFKEFSYLTIFEKVAHWPTPTSGQAAGE